ncbi:MAG: hypothetical protein ACT4P4_29935 [Betaproteobacteria bacterium]
MAVGAHVTPRRPVVLLGGLGAVRGLGRARIAAIVVSDAPQARSSRYCTQALSVSAEGLAHAGRRLAEQYGGPLPLVWDNDAAHALVLGRQADLAPHFAFLMNRRAVAEAALDRAGFQALAARLRLPVPAAIAWNQLEAEKNPVVARSRRRARSGGARLFGSGSEARHDPVAKLLAPRLVFQRYIAGADESLHGFAAPGGELVSASLAGQGDVAALARDIALRLGIAGFFSMTFRRSAASGRLFLLDLSAGFGGEAHVARGAFGYLLGERSLRTQRVLRAAAAHDPAALFAWDDPMPFVRHWSTRLPAGFSRRVQRWLATAS